MSRYGGFSLLEVLVALTILSVGLMGIALLQFSAVRGTASSGLSATAARYAQDQLEIFRGTPFGEIVSSPGIGGGGKPEYPALPTTPGVSTILAGNGIRIYRVWAVSETTPSLKTISVWSCWMDEKGRWHSVHLATQRGDLS